MANKLFTLLSPPMRKILSLLIFTVLALFIFFPGAALSQSTDTAIEPKVKKIVMMLNIVKKEYAAGIAKGEIINAAEYEESQVFLEQAFDRYQSISAKGKGPDAAKALATSFRLLIQSINDKKEHNEINQAVNSINAGLLAGFDVKLNQSPTQPVSLENGQRIYHNACKFCHGVAGKGDGPLAAQFDPKPAVLADPDITGDAGSKPFDNFQIINVGIANTGMVGWADQFSESELWDVTYYIRTFSNENVKLPLMTAGLIAARCMSC